MLTENLEKALRERLGRDCKRLIREAKKLIHRSPELLEPDVAHELSRVFGKTKRKNKAASASSRDVSRGSKPE